MTAAIIVCGGSGTRMGTIGMNKTLLPYREKPLFIHSAEMFQHADMSLVIVVPEKETGVFQAALDKHNLHAVIVPGGKNRFHSVLNGLKACPEKTEYILIHDGARPCITEKLISDVLAGTMEYGSTIPVIPCHDTIKSVVNSTVKSTPDRSCLYRVQTPQGFRYSDILKAYESQKAYDFAFTDDASVLESFGGTVHTVEGLQRNTKITTPEDYAALTQEPLTFLTGIGQDTHRLVSGRDLILCGVRIPYNLGLEGHSDADVAVHALIDALFGAAALGDIGSHFPDNDPQYSGISSLKLLDAAADIIRKEKFSVVNTDITIICQQPKLSPYIPEMRSIMAKHLQLDLRRVSVKATTTEHLGYEGRGEGISASAVATLCIHE